MGPGGRAADGGGGLYGPTGPALTPTCWSSSPIRPRPGCRTSRALRWERSGLSHHIKRMENRGLVRREEVPDDGRGAYVVVFLSGRAASEQAAPAHVRTVRNLIFDSISPDEMPAVGAGG